MSIAALGQARKPERAEKVKDPVCGIMVEKDPELSATHRGETYYFCSRADMAEFKKAPDKYAKK
jgi:YHS domain-containing protein